MKLVTAFVSGLVFAVGLGLGGMTRPSRVVGFLDVAGAWDPSLAFVMGGAVLVGFLAFPAILRQPAPRLGGVFSLSSQAVIDAPLLVGAALFGMGWGLSGYCPGPAVVSLVTLSPGVLLFVSAMLVGLGLSRRLGSGREAVASSTRQG